MQNRILFYCGLTLLTFGILVNVCMYIFEWYPTYIFILISIVGIIQILFSYVNIKIRKTWQTFWSLVPIFSGILYLQIISASKDIFLISENYRGKITIQYGQKNGAEKEFEGLWWRVYKVPKNGILNTKFVIKGNSISYSGSKYYFVDEKGNRKEIKRFCEYCEEKDTTNVQMIIGTLSRNKYGEYQDFYIDIPTKEYRNK
ncbi:DUF6843 domain-containing protein [Flavobacterium sp. W1B]|uniref:DUF6843 domain-containing protein n=1 Tax=Flavobacterium sp. W1B TaxID=3394146 RepID=UPI0039BD2C0C